MSRRDWLTSIDFQRLTSLNLQKTQKKHLDSIEMNFYGFSSSALSYICALVAEPLDTKFGPPHSPDHNSLDYFDRPFIKLMIHKHHHETELVWLKKKIVNEWMPILPTFI